jgi:hypothetical protein
MQGHAGYFCVPRTELAGQSPIYGGRQGLITHTLLDVPLCQIGTELLDF